MKKLILIALIGYGFWHWKSTHHAAVDAQAFDANGHAVAVVYTTDGCGDACNMAMADLDQRKVEYKLINVNMADEQSDGYRAWQSLGVNSFPIVQIGKDTMAGYLDSDMRRIVADNLGAEHLTNKESYYYRQHFDSNGNAQVVLYGTNWCGYCKQLRQDLRAQGIPFLDVDVEPGGSVNKDMADTMGIGGYPVVYVGYQRVQNPTNVGNIKDALKS